MYLSSTIQGTLAGAPNFGPPGVSGGGGGVTALRFGHVGRAALPADSAAAPSHFGHDAGNVGLGWRREYGCVICYENRFWRVPRISHPLYRVVDKLVYVRFSALAYSLRHTPSMAHAGTVFQGGKIQSSPLPLSQPSTTRFPVDPNKRSRTPGLVPTYPPRRRDVVGYARPE